jgi:threonine dehydrogenase-like Zn-dependent dehydrogenase
VIGLGSIGLLFAHALKAAGAARVTGIDVVDRSGVGAAFGLDEVVHASSTGWARGVDAGGAPSIVVEAVGHQPATLNDAIRAVALKGEILYFGLPGEEHYAVDLPRFKDKFLTLYAGTTPLDERRRCLDAAQAYLTEHPQLVDDFVTHVLPVREAPAAYELACAPLPDRVKVLLAADR